MTVGSSHAPDKPFLLISAGLFLAGILILASASVAIAQREYGSGMYFVTHQLTLGAASGIAAAIVVQIIPISWFRAFAAPLFFGTVVLLFVVLIPGIGLGAGGAVRWLQAGPVTVQPGELAKITLPLYLALWFASRTRRVRRGRTQQDENIVLPFLFIIGAVGIPLLLQPDLSMLGILVFTALVLYFLAGAPVRSIALIIMGGLAALLVVIKIAPYRMNRILAFLDPQSDPLGIGYQVNQALLAVGSGGVFGRGLGFSREKLFFLPESMGDAIFAVFAEEAGFIGAVILIALFILFCWRGFFIARRLTDPFMYYLTAGLVSWIVIQAFLNIGGNIAILPIVGITLPFVSYGSASLAVAIMSAGIIYKMSRFTQ